ncbi:MAG: family 20 glycosylhydrolase [Saprospiraceae bacterium]|nr:family 20 glycosylhydrolase [Saprospiraceae bacterium]
MKKLSTRFACLTACLAFFSTSILSQKDLIIPQPVEIQYIRSLPFTLNAATTIGGNNSEAQRVATFFANKISVPTGFNFTIRAIGAIQFNLNEKNDPLLGNEGYRLEILTKNITITANKAAGLFYGAQSLLQLLPNEIETPSVSKGIRWTIPALRVVDYPRFGWRGLMLDVSRHFFTKEEVKRYIDRMARYKYNVFHWHLTDDHGWRIEIKSLPKLTQVGACRVPRFGKFGTYEAPKPDEKATDCGFYTPEDIKEIVAYAAERHIQVLPEIDVPGHSSAAVASYPELCSTKDPSVPVSPGNKFSEWYGNGKFKMLVDNSLDPSNEFVYDFLDKVFTEVSALFPFSYVHMGGDECYHGYWENNPACVALMQKENLKNSHELQSYFVKRVEKILKSKGKKLIGWDEILEGGLAPEASVMSWQGYKGGIEAAKQGHNVVMTPNDFVYIDLLQGEPSVEPDATNYKKVFLKTAFEFEPVPDSVDAKYILGGQANLWTEKVPTIRHAEYMTYPRAWALADVYWSPKTSRDWANFVGRMEKEMTRADLGGCHYAKSAYDAFVKTKMQDGKLVAELETEVPNLTIHYTLDETHPDKHTPQYREPIVIPEGSVTLRAMTFKDGKPTGRLIAISREDMKKRLNSIKE